MPEQLTEVPVTKAGELSAFGPQGINNEEHQLMLKSMALSHTNDALGNVVLTDEHRAAGGDKQSTAVLNSGTDRTDNTFSNSKTNESQFEKDYNALLKNWDYRRGSFGNNPAKILTVGCGMSILNNSPKMGALPIVGIAGLQGLEDIGRLRRSDNFEASSKYSAALVADTSMMAGALGFLSSRVPLRYKAPLLIGGILGRFTLDLISNK